MSKWRDISELVNEVERKRIDSPATFAFFDLPKERRLPSPQEQAEIIDPRRETKRKQQREHKRKKREEGLP